jgi:DNA repair protein RadC
MEQITYERPRERLRAKGVQALATPELIQVVLGSGGPAISVGKLARSVAQLLGKNANARYDDLRLLPGIGDAKACQLLAAIELGRRVNSNVADATALKGIRRFVEPLNTLASAKRPSISYVTFNGAGEVLNLRTVKQRPAEHYSLTSKRIISDVLSDGSASFAVGVGCAKQVLVATMNDLSLAKVLSESAKIINVRLEAFMLVGKDDAIEVALASTSLGGVSEVGR